MITKSNEMLAKALKIHPKAYEMFANACEIYPKLIKRLIFSYKPLLAYFYQKSLPVKPHTASISPRK